MALCNILTIRRVLPVLLRVQTSHAHTIKVTMLNVATMVRKKQQELTIKQREQGFKFLLSKESLLDAYTVRLIKIPARHCDVCFYT